jgi:transcription termination factor Rho
MSPVRNKADRKPSKNGKAAAKPAKAKKTEKAKAKSSVRAKSAVKAKPAAKGKTKEKENAGEKSKPKTKAKTRSAKVRPKRTAAEVIEPIVEVETAPVPEFEPTAPMAAETPAGFPVEEPVGDTAAEPEVAEYTPTHVKKAPPLPGQAEADRPASLIDLGDMPMPELVEQLHHYGLDVHEGVDRTKMLVMFMRAGDRMGLDIRGGGQLEVLPDGYGFLRSMRNALLPAPDDLYVSPNLIAKHHLRAGMSVLGKVRAGRRKEKYHALESIDSINGHDPAEAANWKPFEDLTPVFPNRRVVLERADEPRNFSPRVVDLVAPLGFGQRGLIVSPPRAGKTVLLKDLANAITHNYPDVRLVMFLVDERPEEVTDMRRSVDGEVIASAFDEPAQRHIQVADRVVEHVRSLVESGHDVVVLLDSLTRLGRAYNAVARTTGRILSGGLEANALQKPKRFFGSARNIENGGSLTIVATALIETNSRMDEVIFEEFKGTGNMEIVLNRSISEQRIFPAIDLNKSATRMEDLLYDKDEARFVKAMRQALADVPPVEAIDKLLTRLRKTSSNAEFLLGLATGAGRM